MTDRQRRFDALDVIDLPSGGDDAPMTRNRVRQGRGWIGPVLIMVFGLAAMAAVVFAFLTMVPGADPRERPPIDPASIPPAVEPTELMPVTPETAREMNEKRAFDVTGPIARAPQFVFAGNDISRSRAQACLAAAAFYEAGDDPSGAQSVIQVVLNRARHPAFPRTICGVVFQGSERSTGCQFTFTCDGAMRRTPSPAAWSRAMGVASLMLGGLTDRRVGVATHYHTDWVMPYWAPKLTKLAKVKTHIFYTWPGSWGTPGAFRRGATGEEPAIAALAQLSPAHVGGKDDTATATSTDAPVAVTPTLPAPAPTGIGDRNLRGAIVRTNTGDSNRFFIQVDGGTFAGNHAVAALALCKDKPSCRVYGWRDGGSIASGLPLTDAQRDALTFFYVHEEGSTDRALWNCAQISRSNTAQCLPADAGQRTAVTG